MTNLIVDEAAKLLADLKKLIKNGGRCYDPDKVEQLANELVKLGEYPATDKSGQYSAYKMVGMYGADWHQYRLPHFCPHCNADLRDHKYGTPYKRELFIYDVDKDRTVAWRCPDCKETWVRE